jgi:hypothetical protein
VADNFITNAAAGGATFAADDIGGVHHPRVKLQQGADGAAVDVSAAAPLQVSLANHGANATAVKVDGSAVTQPVSAASLPLPTGATAEATLSAIAGDLGDSADAEAAANGSLIAITKRNRTHLATLAGAVAGTEVQVDVLTSALPTGAATEASLAAAAASLSVLDDWDESDRAKVNIIAGQAGVAAGAGAVGATVQRVTLASDDPAVTALGTLKASLTVVALQVTASGDTQLLASGTRKLKRIEASNSHATVALTVGIKIASLNGGATFGKKYLPAVGGLAVWVFPDGYLPVTAEVINVNLSAAGQVEVTAYYE